MVVPTDWKEVRLGDLVSRPITDGPHLTPRFYNDGVPFLSVNNIVDGKILWNELRYISKEDDKVFAVKCKPRRGDILFGKAASVGKIALVDTDLDFNVWSPLAVIRCSTLSRPQFVYFALQTSWTTRQIALLTNSSSQGNIGMTDIAQIKISLPPLKEQEAIAEALSDTDAAIESLDALIAKKRDVKQGAMQQLLTGRTRLPGFTADWTEVRLSEIADVDPENLSSATSPYYQFNYISLENVSKGRLVGFSEQVFHVAPSRARRILKDLDVLLATVRPNLLGHFLFRGRNNWVGSTGFAVVRCRSDLYSPNFMSQLVFSHVIQAQIELLITGSNYPAINSKDVRDLRVPLPPLKEQEAIAEALTVMDDELDALTEQVSKLRMVKEGMMQDLLTGKVRLV